MNNSPLVSICCTVFNHEKFIDQTLEGFLVQKTTFDFEILISDDASTDSSLHILKKYQKNNKNIKLIQNSVNQYSIGKKPLFNQLFPLAQGKYIALCEGDDYWTDPFKLQKQVDFLENNPVYSACFTNALKVDEDNGTKEYFLMKNSKKRFRFKDIVKSGGGFFPTATLVLRNNLGDVTSFFKDVKSGDRALALLLATKGDFYLLNEVTSVYRLHGGGVFSSISSDKKIRFEIDINNLSLLERFNSYTNFRYENVVGTILSNYSQRILNKYPKELIGSRKNYLINNLNLYDRLRLIKNKLMKSFA